jgi:hypothetical protein
MSQANDPRQGVFSHPAARRFANYVAWLAQGHKIEWRQNVEDWLAGLRVLRAAGWERAITAAIGFVHHYRTAPWIELRELEPDWSAFCVIGEEKRTELRTKKRDRMLDLIGKGVAKLTVQVVQKYGGGDDAETSTALKELDSVEGTVFPPEWNHFDSLGDPKKLPDPTAPYIGELRTLTAPPVDRLEGWKEIAPAVAGATGARELSPKATRERLARAGIEPVRHGGRIFLPKGALERLASPAGPLPIDRGAETGRGKILK